MEVGELDIHELRQDELSDGLRFRSQIFGQVDEAHWRAMNCTGVVALSRNEFVGFIPLQYRQQLLNSEVHIPVVYENAVGVAQDLRGRGIGTKMMAEGGRLVADRAAAMMVIRGGERSDGYRFYRKTGHGDLAYARTYERAAGDGVDRAPSPQGITVQTREQWLGRERELLALYRVEFGMYGGARKREAGYWRSILDGHVFRARKWRLIWLAARGVDLAGYLVAAGGSGKTTEDLHIYELVAQNEDAAGRLIRYACGLVGGAKIIFPSVSLENPVCPILRRMGFKAAPTTPHIMATMLRCDQAFRALAHQTDLPDTLALTVHTPHRSLSVNHPPQPRYSIQLETKENLLSRLFCSRLDLDAALQMQLVRWDCHDSGLGRELCRVLRYAEWVQWFTDYV